VRQSRFRPLLAGADASYQETCGLALDDLERLAHEPRASEGDHPAYLLAAALDHCQQRGDTRRQHNWKGLTTTVANQSCVGSS